MSYQRGFEPVDLVSPDYQRIPTLLRESHDWQTRCIWRPHMIKRGEGRQRFLRRVEERLERMSLRESIPASFGSDLAFYWRTRDVPYLRNLYELALADNAVLPKSVDFFDPRAIALEFSPFHPDGVPFSGSCANANYERYMPLNEQDIERYARHMRECFIPSFMAEYHSYRPNMSGSVYVPLPTWYEEYEVPFSFAHETSPLVAYFGSKLAKASGGPLWVIMLNEQLIFQAVTLVNWAREGRLYWLSTGSVTGLRTIGLNKVCFGAEALAKQLGKLLDEIELIRWDKVPERPQDQPQHAGRVTPVYLNGDWVPFDTAEWRTRLNDPDVQAKMKTSGEMYLPLNPNGTHAFPQQDRGMRVHGFVSRFRANPNPTASESFERPEDGFARNNDTRANYAEVPLGGSQMKRLERMINRYLHNDAGRAETAKDTATLLKDSGHEPMVTLERLTNLVRRGILAERLGFGNGVRQGEPSNPAGASNAETTEPEEIPINIEVLEEPRSRAGVPLAMPPPSRTTTVVITVDEPGEANAGPSRVEVDVPNPP